MRCLFVAALIIGFVGCSSTADVPTPRFYEYWQRSPDGVGVMGVPTKSYRELFPLEVHRKSSLMLPNETSTMRPMEIISLCTVSFTVQIASHSVHLAKFGMLIWSCWRSFTATKVFIMRCNASREQCAKLSEPPLSTHGSRRAFVSPYTKLVRV
jgi:hypothetical protein